MAGIKGVDTKPELLLRKGLHSRGLRFRLHDKRLPGKPDMVVPEVSCGDPNQWLLLAQA